MVEYAIIATIKNYLASLPTYGIHACRAVLFGSYVRGKADDYSDIDLIVIAPEFDGSHEIALVKALWQATVTDNRIEPIPCGEQEWETDGGRPILEIARREGVIITV
jgi:predicted nucleotidyltransferase